MWEITATHGETRAGFPIQPGPDSHHHTQACKRRALIGCNYATKKQVTPLFIPPMLGWVLTPLCHQSHVTSSPPPGPSPSAISPPTLRRKCPFMSPHEQEILLLLFINTFIKPLLHDWIHFSHILHV